MKNNPCFGAIHENGGMDTAVWLAGDKEKTTSGEYSIAQQTIASLCGVGLLGDIIQTKEGLVFYPVAAVIHLFRVFDWLSGERPKETPISTFVALASP